MERVGVECYAGHRADEEPRAVLFGAGSGAPERRLVLAVERRWIEPDAAFFRVRLEGGLGCVLRHDRRTDGWALVEVSPPGTPGRSAGADPGPPSGRSRRPR